MYVETPPNFLDLLGRLDPDRFREVLAIGTNGAADDYLHWDKLRHLDPPDGISLEDWWMAIKLSRSTRPIALKDPEGARFSYGNPDSVLRLLHFVDQRCSGEIAMPKVVTADHQARQHYMVNSLMEEAIRSSQLEGATTSRRVAKQLLRSGRSPKDRSERMIVNNYRALQYMRDEIGDRLTPNHVLRLQEILTDGTLDNPDAAGRLQTPDEERIAVLDIQDGHVIHAPPPAEQLPERLQALCDFANGGQEQEETFVHPVIRAILLHFWLAYDHPFEDGNGRTARALFYWCMRTRGYWLVEYLSISRILRKAPAKYSRSFVLTETDAGDTTYFIIYQLEVIKRAVEEMHAYLERKVGELRDLERMLKNSADLNHRQLALLNHALRDPDPVYTFQTHAQSHGVTHETARTDLLDLTRRGLLMRRRSGRQYVFSPPADLGERLKQQNE
jgi:Fic family protein